MQPKRTISFPVLLRASICALLCTVFHTAIAANHDALTGIYFLVSPETRESVDIIRIEKKDSFYFISSKLGRAGDDWPEAEQARIISMDKFRNSLATSELMGVDLDFGSGAFGLESNAHVILKLAKGWQSGRFKTSTGYLWYSISGAFEIHKRPLAPAKKLVRK